MFDLEEFHKTPPYGLKKEEKGTLLRGVLSGLTNRHYSLCPEYKNMLDALGRVRENYSRLENIPFIPVRLFKKYSLKSVDNADITKTMTSSGTTGQKVSQIYLDHDTSLAQSRALSKIITSYIGNKRLPMLIIDSKSALTDRNRFSARGAGILGFSMYGQNITYALNENMELQTMLIESFLKTHEGERILLFGFTYIIWQYFYEYLKEHKMKLPLENGILIHGGGWKKLKDLKVPPEIYKQEIKSVSGIKNIYDYYGMVEQTGSICMECEYGHLHTSVYSDVIIRRPSDFAPAPIGEKGIVQIFSVLPLSYPGHSLLTEDYGTLLGEDDCPCGRLGKYFIVHGRMENAEIRGCGDTYESK